jgi:hypothetical protein
MSINILPHYTEDEIREMLADVIGEPYSKALRDSVEARTARPTRGYGPGHIVAMDLRAERINLVVDEEQRIVDIHFG